MVDMPENYAWSSYQYYIDKKKKPDWLAIDFIHHYFEHDKLSVQKNYANFVLAKIFDKSDNPLEKTVASTMLGHDSFIEIITEKYLSNRKKDRELPSLRELKKINRIDLVYEEVKILMGESKSISKKAALYICHQYSGKSLKEIGDHFGICESAVSLASYRFKMVIKRDRKLRKNIELIIEKLNL